MPQLEELYLSNSSLAGTLPPDWAASGSFPMLNRLDLFSNSFTGSIPPSWGSPDAFPMLETLYLYFNPNLTGSLPASWGANGSFPSLQTLDFYDADLTGTLPPEWGSPGALPSLTSLKLSYNRINGTLPESWGGAEAFQNLTMLALDNNDISGSVPLSWGGVAAFPKLDMLYLQGDSQTLMCGPIPEGLKNKASLTALAAHKPGHPTSSSKPAPVTTAAACSPGAQLLLGSSVLGVLALLAFRPGKGWLRKGTPPPFVYDRPTPTASLGAVNTMLDSASLFSLDKSKGSHPKQGAGSGNDLEAGAEQPDTIASVHPHPLPSAQTDGLPSVSIGSDPLLSVIASSLASRRAGQGQGSADRGGLPAHMAEWLVLWDQITLDRPIGKGSFGWEDLHRGSVELPQQVMAQLLQEAGVMVRLRPPNIVQFVGLCTLPPCILTEYCSKGSLYDLLRTASEEPGLAKELTWELLVNMALEAARGILYLHSRSPHPIVHRDIKSPNLLVDKNFSVKVSDFNLSKLLATQPSSSASLGGTTNPTWLAPEILLGSKETTASDVYSFGLVMLELLTWQLPWAGRGNFFQVAQMIVSGARPEVPAMQALPSPVKPSKEAYSAYCTLMRECWAAEPGDRPPFAIVVSRLVAIADMT
ncbi:hypothetical protein ABPG77_004900 [Micractinium sp. CCAP 211/92]